MNLKLDVEGWKLARSGRKPINRKLEWKNRQQRLNNYRHFFLKTNPEGVEIDEKYAKERMDRYFWKYDTLTVNQKKRTFTLNMS